MTACGGGGEVDIRFGWWGNAIRNQRTNALLDLFHEENENVFVEAWTVSWNDYWSGLATMAAGGDLPDLVQMDWVYLDQFVANGLLLDLRPWIDDGSIALGNVPAGIVELGRVGEGMFSVPIGMNATGMVYNKTLLDGLGIEVGRNMSIDDFLNISREVYARSGVRTNLALDVDPSIVMELLLRANGVTMMTPDGMGGTPRDYEQFFQLLRLGLDEGWHMALGDVRGRQGVQQNPIVFGSEPHMRSWISVTVTNLLTSLQDVAEEDIVLGMTTFPSDNPAMSNFFRASAHLCITTHSSNPNTAAGIINFWTNNIPANQILLTDRGMPVSTVVADAIYPLLSESDRIGSDLLEFIRTPGNSSPANPPRPSRAGEVVAHMVFLAEGVALGRLTPREASVELFDFGNRVLK